MSNNSNSTFDDIIEFLDRTIASFRGSLHHFRENCKQNQELSSSIQHVHKDPKNRRHRKQETGQRLPTLLNDSISNQQAQHKKLHTMLHVMKPDELTGVKKGHITFGFNATRNHASTNHDDNNMIQQSTTSTVTTTTSTNTSMANPNTLPKFDYAEKIEILPSDRANIPSITLTTVSLPRVTNDNRHHVLTCPPRKVKVVNEKLPTSCLRDRPKWHSDNSKSIQYTNGSSLVANKIKSAYNKVSNKSCRRDQTRKLTLLPTINEQPQNKKDPPYRCSTHFAEVLEEM